MNRNLIFIIALLVSIGCSQVSRVPSSAKSPYFDEVSKHIDLGGTMYMYVDIDQDIEKAVVFLKEQLMKTPATAKKVSKIDVNQLVTTLGLDNMDAIGLSSYKNGDLFTNKGFFYHTGERHGLMSVLGGDAHPFRVLDMAPDDSDLLFECDINLKALVDVVGAVIEQMGTKKDAKDFQEKLLNQKVEKLPITYMELFDKMDTSIYFVAKIDDQKEIAIPNENISFPYVEAFLAIDNFGFLVDEAAKMITQLPFFRYVPGDKLTVIETTMPLPGDLAVYKPVVIRDNTSQRLYLATSQAFLDRCLSNETSITSTSDYREAIAGLPKQGNGLGYLSSKFNKTLATYLGKLAQMDSSANTMLEIYNYIVPPTEKALASVSANLPNGVYFASNVSYSHKVTLLALSYANPLMIGIVGAIAIPTFTKYMGGNLEMGMEFEVEQCYEGVAQYYYENQELPPSSEGWTPSTPPTDEGYTLDESLWQTSPWADINFAMYDNHRNRFRYVKSGNRFFCQSEGVDVNGELTRSEAAGVVQDGEIIREPDSFSSSANE